MKESKIELQSRQYCAAIAVAATAVIGAGIAAKNSYDASQAQKKALAQEGPGGLYGSRPNLPDYGTNLGTEKGGQMIAQDVASQSQTSLPLVMQIANQVQNRNTRQRNRMTGGAFSQTMNQEGRNIAGMEQGQIPQDVQDSIQRMVAEHLGGGMGPASAPGATGFGASMAQNTMARNLGTTSYDIARQGMALAPQWRSNVDSFLYKPQEAMSQFYLPQAQIAQNVAANQYNAQSGQAMALAQPNPQITGALNDAQMQAARNTQTAQMASQALTGLGTSYSAWNQGRQASNTTQLNNTNAVLGSGAW